MGKLFMLRIEIDSHLHGSSDVPRPWVARLDGPCPKFGMQRTFLDALNDWSGAKVSFGKRPRGLVACFALRGGATYEVSRLRGRGSKRRVVREYCRIEEDGSWVDLELGEALALVDPCPDAVPSLAPDGTQVAVIHGLGTPTQLGFLLDESRQRWFRLRPASLHEVIDPDGQRRILTTAAGAAKPITTTEALQWLIDHHHR